MFRLSICYHEPADKSAFDLHYANVHVPIVRAIPGLLGLTAGRCRPLAGGHPAPYYMIATLDFDTAEKRSTALATREMATAGADLKNFSAGTTMYTTDDIAFAG